MEHICCHQCTHWEFAPERRYWGICRLLTNNDATQSLVHIDLDNDEAGNLLAVETHADFSCAKFKASESKLPTLGVVKGRVA